MGGVAPVFDLWACGMLRQLSGKARHGAFLPNASRGDGVVRTGPYLGLVLRPRTHAGTTFPGALISLQRCAYRSMTTSSTGCAQQVSRVPIAGNSSGSGW